MDAASGEGSPPLMQSIRARPSVLDPAQLGRIESVHRGFLFQHLYAVQCLLSAATLKMQTVSVEGDEDVEVQLDGTHIYVQVKHRKEALAWDDIESALARFAELRAAHARGVREGTARFVIVCNAGPNGPLLERLAGCDLPPDVTIDWPAAEPAKRILPVPQPTLMEAVQATCGLAETLPFATLAPETLVWKLAGLVTLAATGEKATLDHVFAARDLPALFEQLVLQLQDLPVPPVPYRVQLDEPSLSTGERVRLIVGYSGAGKTSWLAQSAQHAPNPLVYLDVADLPGAALANAVAREIAGRLLKGGQGLGEIFLPGASGREILQLLSRRMDERGEVVTVALDNVHKLGADDLIGVVQAAKDTRFVLLGRPEGEVAAIEAIIGVARENLSGWAPDTVAAAAHDAGCHGDAADCQHLIDLTGGLPLFVLNALSVAGSDYDGSVKRLYADLARSAHTREMAQDHILGRVFARLPAVVAEVADLLSLCDVPITREEAGSYVAAAGGLERPIFLQALRHLMSQGLLQVFARDRIKLHDAARVVGTGRLALHGTDALRTRQEALRTVVQESLQTSWSPAKLSLFLRLTGEVGRLDLLVEMATEELFHEMGVWPEVEPYLEQGAEDETVPPDQRIKALDALAFADIKAGSDRAAAWLDQMDALITKHDLGAEERLRVGMKRMNLLAKDGDRRGAVRLIADLTPIVQELPAAHRRIFSYNIACAELELGEPTAAAERVEPLIGEYYGLIGLTSALVMGNNAPDLAKMMKKGADVDDIKHLADSLDVFAKARDAQGKPTPLARVHALKFYDLAHAPDSLFRVGQDLVDQFIRRRDFDGALNVMETMILPQLRQWKLADYLITVRSHYAVVLAYCSRFDDAEAEMARLKPYEPGLKLLVQNELAAQRELIRHLRAVGPPPKWVPAPGLLQQIAAALKQNGRPLLERAPAMAQKIGRNERCPCGSGEKYKRCHGRLR
ncbi:SEC-C metal-binding domain-containing protein [Mesorhizobium sp. VK25A]|uniref:SEC-C metal-binding domain-containing protein n=1 Tax=Mesorhizobium vachelliae TaxID=3072309 RepID=A0ABU5ADC3_9HYPH|nr:MULTISPECIES: SEC-C metal-binding domain-containing protein [unclassified Mesorhizobium]MDX8535299.1 SEC-C metal-binding domain-containing protein [Mesorhizobium sp. VK25D]MDX8548030.1 SEC-C metal-binding domain-containing protein [Mesorhizobium sp. VK25A]